MTEQRIHHKDTKGTKGTRGTDGIAEGTDGKERADGKAGTDRTGATTEGTATTEATDGRDKTAPSEGPEVGGETAAAAVSEKRARANFLSGEIIGAAIEVHRVLGPGLLESAYEECLARELSLRGLAVRRQVSVPLEYKGVQLACSYRLDVLVEDLVVVEVKAVDHLEPVHEAQVLTYLRLTGRWLGLLINFNCPLLINGVKRLVHG